MKWFDKWFAKKCKQAWEEERLPKEEFNVPTAKIARAGRLIGRDTDSSLNSHGTQFTLYSANGGTVVELRDYNQNTDRVQNILYVIPSDRDLGEQLGHIVTTEALKR